MLRKEYKGCGRFLNFSLVAATIGAFFPGLLFAVWFFGYSGMVVGCETVDRDDVALPYNALAVFVDGSHVGYIPMDWISEVFHDMAVQDLASRRGGLAVDQTVTLELRVAADDEVASVDDMIAKLGNHHFTYELASIAIYVFDPHTLAYRREAVMRSMEDVVAVRHLLTQRFVTPNTVYYGFYPDWQLVPVEACDDANFHTPQEAFAQLDRRIRSYVEYVIGPDETLIGIARAFDMDLMELLRINQITAGTTVHPGQRIWVVTQGALLPVITVEEEEWIVKLDRHIERIYVDTLHTAQTRLIQEGSDGEIRVLRRTTRRNIEVIDVEEVFGEVIIPAEPRIVEIGR